MGGGFGEGGTCCNDLKRTCAVWLSASREDVCSSRGAVTLKTVRSANIHVRSAQNLQKCASYFFIVTKVRKLFSNAHYARHLPVFQEIRIFVSTEAAVRLWLPDF